MEILYKTSPSRRQLEPSLLKERAEQFLRVVAEKIVLLLLLWLPLISFSQQKSFTHTDTLRGSMNPQRMYDVKYYHLNITSIDTATKYINGTVSIYFKALADLDSIQVDLDTSFTIRPDVAATRKIEGTIISFPRKYDINLKYHRIGKLYYLIFEHTVKKDSIMRIDLEYYGKPREAVKAPWDGGFVWRHDGEGNIWLGTACEGIGASTWWPCKDYLGDEPDSMRIEVVAPKNYYCKSNGRLEKYQPIDIDFIYDIRNPDSVITKSYEQYIWKVDYPINTYDVTLNIGKYADIKDSFYSKNGKMDIHFYPLEENRAKAHSYFPTRTKQMLKCFEHYFGPYPFFKDGYSLVETSYWGMEHQGAIAYGNHFKDSTLGYNFDFILIHETAHEWWGNSLSCTDEAEMWLHESFATYAEALYVEYFWGKEAGIDYLMKQKPRIKNAGPVIGPFGVNYDHPDNDIYYKGSWMLHSLRNTINNDSLWFKIIYTFATKYHCLFVHTSDFTRLVDSMTGKNYDAFFDVFLAHKDLPVLEYSIKKRLFSAPIINFRWYAWTKGFGFQMPLDIKVNKKIIRIYPTSEFQELKVPGLKDNSIDYADKLLLFKKSKLMQGVFPLHNGYNDRVY